MVGTAQDRNSLRVRYVVDESDGANPFTGGLTMNAVDLPAEATLNGLIGSLDEDEDRERLRSALNFDLFEFFENSLNYRSQDPHLVYLYQGSRETGKRWWIPRPPLIEILDDWESFLQTAEPFEKVYTWGSDQAASRVEASDATRESEAHTTPVTVTFQIDERTGMPGAATDNADANGRDRLAGLFGRLVCSHERLAELLTERESLSWWSNVNCVVRCESRVARIWTNDESLPDDFVELSRSQLEAMIDDWIGFAQDPKPFTQAY